MTFSSHHSACQSRHLLRAAAYVTVLAVLHVFPAGAQDTTQPPHLLGPGTEVPVVSASAMRARAVAGVSPERLILVPSSNSARDNLGLAVSLSGQTAVAGAWLSDRAGLSNSGAAHVFERHHSDIDAWGEIRTLTASSPSAEGRFGVSTAIDGDVIVVGAYLDDTAGGNAGAAYVYERNQGGPQNWGQVAILTASDAAPSDRFGVSVAVDGDVIVVGAYGKDLGQSDVGAAYVFRRNVDGWAQAPRLTHLSGLANDEFGISVAVSTTNVAVGAWGRPVANGGSDAGAVYLFQLGEGTNWTRGPTLRARDPASAAWFGRAVAMAGNTLAVGARGVGAQTNSGSVSIFHHSGSNWTDVASIAAPAGAVDDHFGISVALNTNNLAVGAFGTQSVYTYTNSSDGLTWQQGVPIIHHGGGFGLSVALDQAGIFIGAYLDDHFGDSAGAAYIEIGNSTPRATNDTFSVFEDSTLSTNVLGNDFDSDDVGGTLSAFLISPPTNTAAFVFNPDGSFIYTPRSNSIAPDTFTYYVTDGALTSSVARAVIAIIPVNDPPSFVTLTNHVSLEDSGPQTVAEWATSIDPGAPDEASQALTFLVSTSSTNLFSVLPAISPTGTLSYMAAPNSFGTANVAVQLRDDAGGLSPQKAFSISVTPVNDPPDFTIGPDITAVYNAGFQIIPRWARNITAGPGETNQALTFMITPTNSPLFSVQPVVSPVGDLSFITEGASIGTGVFNLILRDNGGTTNHGRNTSDSQAFVVTMITNQLPILRITPLGSDVMLSWPLGLSTNLVLQVRTNLAQPWTNAPSGSANFIAVPRSDRAGFFRLGTSP